MPYYEEIPAHNVLEFNQNVGEALANPIISFSQNVEFQDSLSGVLLYFSQNVVENISLTLPIIQVVIDEAGT